MFVSLLGGAHRCAAARLEFRGRSSTSLGEPKAHVHAVVFHHHARTGSKRGGYDELHVQPVPGMEENDIVVPN